MTKTSTGQAEGFGEREDLAADADSGQEYGQKNKGDGCR